MHWPCARNPRNAYTTRQRPIGALCVVTALGLSIAAGCGDPLPSSQQITSTRVLAMKSEVVGPLFPETDPDAAVRCQALPFETVRITPFIVDPAGPVDPLTIEPLYIACNLNASQGLFACLKSAIPTDLASIPECPLPSFADLDPEAEAPPEPPSPCILPADGSDDGLQDLTIPFATALIAGGDVEVTMFGHMEGGPTTRACADMLLSGDTELPNDCIFAVQRVSVGPIEALLLLASMFGVELPPELVGELPAPEDVPDSDRNPRIESFSASILRPDGSLEELGELNPGDTITAALGDVIQFTTVAPEADLQTYPVQVNNGESTEDKTEAYDAHWFVSWGELLSGTSDDPTSVNEWSLTPRLDQEEPERPEGDVGTLFYVVRDGRQGVDWWWLRLVLSPE
ncbi:MAG TPA: hypothetical protein ENK31_01305 [Nannocystis exedens]|nr:hypothetical protein [Nannocystis exedens]